MYDWTKAETLSLPTLKKLHLDISALKLLKVIENCKLLLLSISYGQYESNIPKIDARKLIKNFLKGQNDLENLILHRDADDLFDGIEIAEMSFKLKSLSLTGPSNDESSISNFFNLHKDSLEEIETDRNNSLELFQEFNNIKHVSFRYSTTPMNITLPSVQKITFQSWYRLQNEAFGKAFPNVKEIHIDSCTIRYDFLAELPKVEKLSIVGCELLSNLTCTNLRILRIDKLYSQVGNKLNGFNQLKELVVKNGKDDLEVITNFLELNDNNLHRLKLIGKNYMPNKNPTLHRIINQNRHKIKYLTIRENE
jgi:hypothetical protein